MEDNFSTERVGEGSGGNVSDRKSRESFALLPAAYFKATVGILTFLAIGGGISRNPCPVKIIVLYL